MTKRDKVTDWYRLKAADVLGQLRSDGARGLSEEEAARRLEEYGPNQLVERGAKGPWRILWEQLTSTLVVILIVAAVISAGLGDWQDSIAILSIVILNAVLGVHQEYKAEQAMAALKRLAVPSLKVRREGDLLEISARDLVPGDIVVLEAGTSVPADGRLIESSNLRIQEAALTGESEPVEKDAEAVLETDKSVGDRLNMAYMGTSVTYGRGLLAVTETGMQTELGRIAHLIQSVEREPTPLQRRLDQLGRVLVTVAIGIVTVIFVFGLLRGEEPRLMFLTAVSLAVAAVPEGLPAVVTIALALGAQRMLKRKALIRKLPAVETLGSVTVICSDKTGTLTQNLMTVTAVEVSGKKVVISSDPANDSGDVSQAEDLKSNLAVELVLAAGTLCNDAVLKKSKKDNRNYEAVGDPTEGALVTAAARLGLAKDELEESCPRVGEVPFDSNRKRMTTVHRVPGADLGIPASMLSALPAEGRNGGYLAFTKGAIDSVLQISTKIWADGQAKPLDENWREKIGKAHDELAQEGMRILGVGFRPLEAPPSQETDEVERELTFLGFVAMIDPARPEVADAVETCRSAGLRALMITGDHPLTARHIAEELGIRGDGELLTGSELEPLSEDELEKTVESVSVYARVSPEHKLKIVGALQKRGHLVAMTGDGVNDAPALKKADIGVAMGITGTDVSKEASDMVLQDDNFATIVAAIEEGRIIFDNIRKFIKYLLSANSGELWVMFVGPFLGMPLPLLPLQILWMNLITDGPPALALGVEPAERDIMKRPPYPPGESLFGRGLGRGIITIGLVMAVVSLGIGYYYWAQGLENWQTMLFTTITFSQMGLAWAVRSERDSVFSAGLFTNRPLAAAVALSTLLHLAVIYTPALQSIFETIPLEASDLLVCLLASSLVFWALEAEKWLMRRRATR